MCSVQENLIRNNFLVREWLFPVEVGSSKWLQMGIVNK